MPIVSFVETFLSAATINTTHTFSAQHNFPAPGLTVWSRPFLQSITTDDDDHGVVLRISQFKDNSGTHNVNFNGLFANKCTSVTFTMKTTNCAATAMLTTEIFG